MPNPAGSGTVRVSQGQAAVDRDHGAGDPAAALARQPDQRRGAPRPGRAAAHAGCCAANDAAAGRPYSRALSARIGVSVEPGLTALAVTPVAPSSAASARISPATPALAAQYAASIGSPRVAAADATARNRPERGSGRRSSAGNGGAGQAEHPAQVGVEHRALLAARHLPERHAAGDHPGDGHGGVQAAPAPLG